MLWRLTVGENELLAVKLPHELNSKAMGIAKKLSVDKRPKNRKEEVNMEIDIIVFINALGGVNRTGLAATAATHAVLCYAHSHKKVAYNIFN